MNTSALTNGASTATTTSTSTQAQELTKKVAKLKSKDIEFKTLSNREIPQLSSIINRFIKICNPMFNYCPSSDPDTCGISYYSKKDTINLNGIINNDGTVCSKLEVLWSKFKSIFIEEQQSSVRLYCRHLALAWVTNELDIKNINNLLDLKKSDFLTKFAGKEASLEEILAFYDLYYKTNDTDNETNKLKFSSNNFSELLNTICCEMQQYKEQSRSYLFTTPAHNNKAHMLALKISIKNNVVKIKFYDPNDTLREKNIVLNSINDVRNLKLKDLLSLKDRIAYRIDNFITAKNNEENCTLQLIPNGYSITQNRFIKSIINFKNSSENRCAIIEAGINKMKKDSEIFMKQMKAKFIQYTNEVDDAYKKIITPEQFYKKLDALVEPQTPGCEQV